MEQAPKVQLFVVYKDMQWKNPDNNIFVKVESWFHNKSLQCSVTNYSQKTFYSKPLDYYE